MAVQMPAQVQLDVRRNASSVATPQQDLKAFKKQFIAAGSSESVTARLDCRH